MSSHITIAIQKAGRLSEDSFALLADCGIRVQNGIGKLKSVATGFPAEIFYLRDDDIPQYVADGVADIGIVGRNVVAEKNKHVTEVQALDFGRCRMSIAIKNTVDYPGTHFLQGKRIATSYTRILNNFLMGKKIQAEIHEISGSVEIAPSVGMADAIFDIVSSGSTLFVNGLKEVEVVLQSQAVLISGPSVTVEKQRLLDQLTFRMDAVKRSKNNRYILFNVPTANLPEVVKLVPGMKSPTVLPLAEEGWCSVHSVIGEIEFWEILGKLKACGAEGILVVPIEKMIV